jgi:hypothetical protein
MTCFDSYWVIIRCIVCAYVLNLFFNSGSYFEYDYCNM